jgi:hypothetical protein
MKTIIKSDVCFRFLWESQKERNHLEDQGVDGSMGSEWILGRMAGVVKSGSIWLRIGMETGCCKHGDDLLVMAPWS